MRHAQHANGGGALGGASLRYPVPSRLRRLYIMSDNDAAGEGAAASLSDRARAAVIEVIILSPTLDDFNEDLRWLGVDELRAAIRAQLASEDIMRFLELPA